MQVAQQVVQIRLPRSQDRPAQHIQPIGLCGQVCLPRPFGDIGIGHGGLVELPSQCLASGRVKGDAMAQQAEQVVEHLCLCGVGGFDADKQATATLELTEDREHI